MQQLRRSALRKAAQAGSRRAFGYRERFQVAEKGLGVSKAQSLSVGINLDAPADAASLAKMWPVTEESAAATAASKAVFESVLAHNPADKAAALGKARAETALGEYDAAKKTLDAAGCTPADGEFHRAYLAAKAAVLVREVEAATAAQAAEPNKPHGDVASLAQQTSEAFAALTATKPDWEAQLAYGEYLIARQDPGAEFPLAEAVKLAQSNVTGRAGSMEHYVSDKTSTAALADYVDYKHQVVLQNKALGDLLGSTDRTEPAMEALLTERYPGYSAEQLLAVLPIASAVESGALGLGDVVRPMSRVRVRDFDSPMALELNYLIGQYTGGGLGAAARAPADDVDAALALIENNSDVVDIHTTVRLQKKLALSLAENVRDLCLTALGEAHSLAGNHAAAVKVLNEVVKGNKFTGMYRTLNARGDAHQALGNVEAADKDHKRAYKLEDALVDVDIPTWDTAAHRNEF